MMHEYGATINGRHTYRDYGLYIGNIRQISPPAVKTTFIQIPARNGDIDVTEALTGYPVYGNRTLTLYLGGRKRRSEWVRFRDTIENEIHGKKVKVVFDDDPEFYWEGRATMSDDYDRGQEVGSFTVTVNVQPYKLEMRDGGDGTCWPWDTFNFHTGIIRNYHQIRVDGTRDILIIGREMPVIPTFDVDGSLTVTYRGEEYGLAKGTNKIYDIVLMKGEHILTFKGNGTVTVHYRGGTL